LFDHFKTVLKREGFGRELFGLAVIFVLSRIIVAFLGVRFDMSPLQWFYQYIDPVLLKENLMQSLVYLHSQPPVYNLYLGVVLKYGGLYAPVVFRATYLITGMLSLFALYTFMRLVRIHHAVAFFCTAFFAVSPPVLFYENWLFYTYPLAFVLCLSAFLLLVSLKTRSPVYLFLFFIALSCLVLTRTLFHTVWFVAIFCWLLIHHNKNRKRIVLSALVPFLLICSVHAKNYLLFRQPTLTSWFGMNLMKMTFTIPRHLVQQEILAGAVTDIALIMPFQAPETYQQYMPEDSMTGIPVLDNRYKSTGAVNFNYHGYRNISHQYFAAADHLIRRYPQYYGQSVIKAAYQFLRPCSDSIIITGHNRRSLHAWVTVYEQYLLGDVLKNAWHTTFTNQFGHRRTVHVNLLYLFIPLLYLFGTLIACRKSRLLAFSPDELFSIRYIMLTIGYVTIVGNLFDASENMRFRFLIVPFLYVIIGILITYAIAKYRSKP
jgi:hypothetical protein